MATQPASPSRSGNGSGSRNTRLELTWIGKENRPRLEPRILLEDADKSYHAAQRVSDKDIFDNRLIFGDNLLALKALEQEFTGKVKCIFIDPPYNTGSAFTHYDDGVEHSIWLSLMRDRLEILRKLLSEDGSIWVSIDDNEASYLKILLDEVFGRANFLSTFVWKKAYGGGAKSKWFVGMHEYIHCFVKNREKFPDMFLSPDPNAEARYYKLRDSKAASRGPFRVKPLEATKSMDRRENLVYPIPAPDGTKVWPKRQWWWAKERAYAAVENDELYFTKAKDGSWSIQYKQYLRDEEGNERLRKPTSIFDGPYTQDGTKESIALFGNEGKFAFPKPEGLVSTVIEACSKPGDLVLDSFAGSGTTGAVAHKMGRRWIMIELGEHTHSHIIPRMKKVIDGQDAGGVTETAGWNGGGGFRYFRLAPSMLELDRFGNHVISRKYNPAMLAEAMCKLMGFRYEPGELYWQQGRSTETDFLYTTTQTLSRQQLESLSEEVGPNQSLLICCSAFRGKAADYPNLTIRKIPMAVLARCEWGKDDYSLNVANLPKAPEPNEEDMPEPLAESAHADRPPRNPAEAKKRKAKAAKKEIMDLFATPAEAEVGVEA
ncbi:MAG TPA: site-specific DNA-methyltransferase [Candidatus Aquilonibacter sp.]|nr:site-specific DNA-methyltransferase [Candidatus Aquilonibacter sp.]